MYKLSRILFVFSLLIIISLPSVFSQKAPAKVKWYTMEEAEKACKENPKKIFIDIYTSWCGWCKVMDNKTFSHPVIAEYLNEHFYPVKFNAEQADTLIFKGHTFVNQNPYARRSTHTFAVALLDGRLAYPTVVFLDENLERIFPSPGYKSPEAFDGLMHYIAEDHYKKMEYNAFTPTFKPTLNKKD